MILENNKENINLFIKKILNGDVVIFPTDTVFGIGCDATNTNAIEEIYKLKGREKTKTLLLNLPSITEIKKIAHISNIESLLLENFNELTLIVKVKPNTHLSPYTIKNNEIGVRIPKNETLKTILREINTPLISTSCNKSGEPACTTDEMANKIFPQITILQSNELLSGTPSTIIKVIDNQIEVLRQGTLTIEKIKQKIKEI